MVLFENAKIVFFYHFRLFMKMWNVAFWFLAWKEKNCHLNLFLSNFPDVNKTEWKWQQKLFLCRHIFATSYMLIAKSYNRIHNFTKKSFSGFHHCMFNCYTCTYSNQLYPLLQKRSPRAALPKKKKQKIAKCTGKHLCRRLFFNGCFFFM